MLDECIEALKIDGTGVYVDVTFGGGGHSKKIRENLTEGVLVVFDKDKDASRNVLDDEQVLFVPHDFRYIKRYLKYLDKIPVNGILADLGISSHQIDSEDRGFAHRFDGDLDMRMDTSAGKTAADILNEYDQDKLIQVLREYGELREAYKITRLVCDYRRTKKIEKVSELKNLLAPITPAREENKFYSKVFQALRIEVNQELEGLKEMLKYGADCLGEGGRFVVLTYHSLEDRIVKQFFNSGNFKGEIQKDHFGNIERDLDPLFKKPMLPTAAEIEVNSRARSAKLRVAVKR